MKKFVCLLLALIACVSSSSAAVVVQFSSDGAPRDSSLPVNPDYVFSQSEASGMIPSGSLNRLADSLTYSGWSTALDLNRYIGFTVTAKPGYSLCLTELSFDLGSDTASHVSSLSEVALYCWAYRIDNGYGYSAWNFSSSFPGTGLKGSTLTWDFADFSSTGTIEFGLFACAQNPKDSLNLDRISVDGVFAPEPASGLMTALSGSLALLQRRRKNR